MVSGSVLSMRQNPKNTGNGTGSNPAFQFGTDPMRGVNAGGWYVSQISRPNDESVTRTDHTG